MKHDIFEHQINRLNRLKSYYQSVSVSLSTTKEVGKKAVDNYCRVILIQHNILMDAVRNIKIETINH